MFPHTLMTFATGINIPFIFVGLCLPIYAFKSIILNNPFFFSLLSCNIVLGLLIHGTRTIGEECFCRDWHGCIMAQSIVGLENVQPYKFSECSKKDYFDALRTGHGLCLLNKPNEVRVYLYRKNIEQLYIYIQTFSLILFWRAYFVKQVTSISSHLTKQLYCKSWQKKIRKSQIDWNFLECLTAFDFPTTSNSVPM